MIYICEICGSSDLEEEAWVKINTGKIMEIKDDSDVWCCNCEKEVNIKGVK
jgi:hypothetical protein